MGEMLKTCRDHRQLTSPVLTASPTSAIAMSLEKVNYENRIPRSSRSKERAAKDRIFEVRVKVPQRVAKYMQRLTRDMKR